MVDPTVILPDTESKKIGGDCMLGAGTKIGERCTFKRSIIGAFCCCSPPLVSILGERCTFKRSIMWFRFFRGCCLPGGFV